MLLRVVDSVDGKTGRHIFRDIFIQQGEAFLLPALVPHNPIRYADTIGLVIERVRGQDQIDRLRWYCERCTMIVHEEAFHCSNINTDLSDLIQKYAQCENLRTCKSCALVNT